MKKNMLMILLAVLSVTACKKDHVTPATASFTTIKSGYYLNEKVTLVNTSSGKSYSWDFGDGASSTVQSPTHSYATSGTFKIKLTVNGTVSATKAIKVFNGTASYQLTNQSTLSLPLVSFSVDESNNITDFVNNGIVAPGGFSDTVFTNDGLIYIGGVFPNDSSFIAIYPFDITSQKNNILTLADTSQIIINSIAKRNVNQFFRQRANAQKTLMSKQINLIKRTVQ